MKKTLFLVSAGLLAASTVIVAPVAQAKEILLDGLPYCEQAAGKIEPSAVGAKRADVHGSKGKEYIYFASCAGKGGNVSSYVAVTNAKGKLVSSGLIGKNDYPSFVSGSRKSGIRLEVTSEYKGLVTFTRAASVKLSSSSKKATIKKDKRPAYVRAVYDLHKQAAAGKDLNAVSGSKASMSKLKVFAKVFKTVGADSRTSVCLPTKKASVGKCKLMLRDRTGVEQSASFTVTGKAQGFAVSKVKIVSNELSMGTS